VRRHRASVCSIALFSVCSLRRAKFPIIYPDLPLDCKVATHPTYIRIKGKWRYLYRAVDSTGATLDFLLSAKQDAAAAKRFLAKALGQQNHPAPLSSTPMGMRLTRPRSLSSRVKERWTPAASTGRCRT
jgi:hypothetical protein